MHLRKLLLSKGFLALKRRLQYRYLQDKLCMIAIQHYEKSHLMAQAFNSLALHVARKKSDIELIAWQLLKRENTIKKSFWQVLHQQTIQKQRSNTYVDEKLKLNNLEIVHSCMLALR